MENITNKSRSKEIIQTMQNILDGASSVPLSQGKVSIYKEEMQTLLTELAIQLDIELKTYYEVNDRRGKIISEAKKDAERIILEAEQTASRMRVSKSATGVSPLDVSRLNQEELDALSNANEIYGASLIYTDEMLTEVSEMIETAYQNIRGDYEIVMQVMEEKLNTINSNRNELMTSLQEMDGAERSQQILEIGQLLSSELYRSRMKEKMNSDEYEDGSIQLSLELVEEQEEKARQAQEKAERAQAALAQMTAERDALRQTVQMMKKEGMAATVKDVKDGNGASVVTQPQPVASVETPVSKTVETPATKTIETAATEEYEVIYVSEDELVEGEEYEVEYVDDDEYEKIMNQMGKHTKPKAPVKEVSGDALEEEEIDIPLIPRFKKVEKVATISSGQMNSLKNAPQTVKAPVDKGFIGRAVKEKEKSQVADTVKVDVGEAIQTSSDSKSAKKPQKDPDVKMDSDGNEYVQATMKFDEDFEITEF
ncbi:MAG: hypothetical protein ACI4F4_02295 [Lachnospiraceae bacterium]